MKVVGQIGLMAMMVFLCTSFTANEIALMSVSATVQKIESEIQELRSAVGLDSSRAVSLQKIYGIIDKYNPGLSATDRFLIANEIYKMSIKYDNLDVDLICATISHESAFTWRNDVVSRAGALGLMQIMPNTGYFLSQHEGISWTNAREVLFNPIYNIRMGCRYLSSLIDLYQIDGGLAAYNGGHKQAAKWLASGRDNTVLVAETRDYVPAILTLYEIYRN